MGAAQRCMECDTSDSKATLSYTSECAKIFWRMLATVCEKSSHRKPQTRRSAWCPGLKVQLAFLLSGFGSDYRLTGYTLGQSWLAQFCMFTTSNIVVDVFLYHLQFSFWNQLLPGKTLSLFEEKLVCYCYIVQRNFANISWENINHLFAQ